MLHWCSITCDQVSSKDGSAKTKETAKVKGMPPVSRVNIGKDDQKDDAEREKLKHGLAVLEKNHVPDAVIADALQVQLKTVKAFKLRHSDTSVETALEAQVDLTV